MLFRSAHYQQARVIRERQGDLGGLATTLHNIANVFEKQGDWRAALKNMIFLGTPHQGAPLEKAGGWIDVILGSTPYSKPFVKLGQLRSAGITDLRFGRVLDADQRSVPLPEGGACYTVAAALAPKRSPMAERIVGDGLVPLPSALGQRSEAQQALQFARGSQYVDNRTNHMQLLHSAPVTAQLLKWLRPHPGDGED